MVPWPRFKRFGRAAPLWHGSPHVVVGGVRNGWAGKRGEKRGNVHTAMVWYVCTWFCSICFSDISNQAAIMSGPYCKPWPALFTGIPHLLHHSVPPVVVPAIKWTVLVSHGVSLLYQPPPKKKKKHMLPRQDSWNCHRTAFKTGVRGGARGGLSGAAVLWQAHGSCLGLGDAISYRLGNSLWNSTILPILPLLTPSNYFFHSLVSPLIYLTGLDTASPTSSFTPLSFAEPVLSSTTVHSVVSDATQ